VPLFAGLALAAAATALTAFGLTRRNQAGWAWWIAAIWMVVAGVALGALLPDGRGTPLAAPLLMQWPLVTLIGVRRFFARQPWPGDERSDALLLTVASLFALLGSLILRDSIWLISLCSLSVHLYAAAVLFMGPSDEDSTPLHVLGATMALVAFAPGLARLSGASELDADALRALAAALGVIVLAFVSLTLANNRSERQLRQAQQRMATMATLDTLTQVPNRLHFKDLAAQSLRNDPPGSSVLLLFDVDHFRQINEHLGTAAGDRALRLVSASMVEHLRALDVAGRLGGDEFVLLLRRVTTESAMGVAARIVSYVQEHAPGMQLPILCLSFGMVQVAKGEDIDGALRRADLALVEAKRQGRSCAVTAMGDADEPVFSAGHRLGAPAAC
ncbi:MAG TPA: GGDEF domain-containing protein, partial [Rubrivivax sp.]|nr:GGDEF domain-containing protein [Rubrivivax sp.]